MSVSFLDLPKELKIYILSLHFVIHAFESPTNSNLPVIVDWACDDEYQFKSYNNINRHPTFLRMMSLIHPSIRSLLKSMCIFSILSGEKVFRFREQFFTTILTNKK